MRNVKVFSETKSIAQQTYPKRKIITIPQYQVAVPFSGKRHFGEELRGAKIIGTVI